MTILQKKKDEVIWQTSKTLKKLDIEVEYKPNYQKLSHKILAFFLNIIFKDFQTEWANQWGKYIYLPSEGENEKWYINKKKLIRVNHEIKHRYQVLKNGQFLFSILYLFSWRFRLKKEFEAYCVQIAKTMELYPNFSNDYFINRIKSYINTLEQYFIFSLSKKQKEKIQKAFKKFIQEQYPKAEKNITFDLNSDEESLTKSKKVLNESL